MHLSIAVELLKNKHWNYPSCIFCCSLWEANHISDIFFVLQEVVAVLQHFGFRRKFSVNEVVRLSLKSKVRKADCCLPDAFWIEIASEILQTTLGHQDLCFVQSSRNNAVCFEAFSGVDNKKFLLCLRMVQSIFVAQQLFEMLQQNCILVPFLNFNSQPFCFRLLRFRIILESGRCSYLTFGLAWRLHLEIVISIQFWFLNTTKSGGFLCWRRYNLEYNFNRGGKMKNTI